MRSWYAIRARAEGAEVSIYDEIGAYGVSAKSFLDELGALPDDGPLTLRLNSPGGSVFDAVAIYNALKRHAGPVSVWIDGIAASAASYVAMAGDEVVMPENAFLMIHDPSGVMFGTADDMRAMAEALDKIKSSLVAGYAAKSGGPEDDIRSEAHAADIVIALDRLEACAPNVESVSLVVAWFGDDLRAGHCRVRPGVEVSAKSTTPKNWSVNGISRGSAHLVSRDDQNRPAYGGTPSDSAVVQAIRELKARGYRVIFYPFILMDVPADNELPDPYSNGAAGTGQPAYPWRGRINCSPAAGYAGSVDKGAAAGTQVAAFFGDAHTRHWRPSDPRTLWSRGAGRSTVRC